MSGNERQSDAEKGAPLRRSPRLNPNIPRRSPRNIRPPRTGTSRSGLLR